ncbi:MAG: S-layer homology domain-containing protein [Cyanobacteria bacterium REEB67]|nr:S-layer homology domain-containing protein [Cyanobacteria bacterium REEB67]
MKLAKSLALSAVVACCLTTQPARSSDFVKNLLQQFSGTVTNWDDLDSRRASVEGQIRQSVRSGELTITDADQLRTQLAPIADAVVQGRASGKALTFSQGLLFSQKLNSVTAALQQAIAAKQSSLPDIDALQTELSQNIDQALNTNQLTADDAARLKDQLRTTQDIETTIKSSGDGSLSPKQIETISGRLSDIKTQLVQAIKMGQSALPELNSRAAAIQHRIGAAMNAGQIGRDQAAALSGELARSAQRRDTYANGGANLNGRQILELAGDLDRTEAKLDAAINAARAASQLPPTQPVQTQVNVPAASAPIYSDTDNSAYNGPDNAVKYKDVTGYWGEPYVSTLAARGILGGFPDGTFHPNDNITRAQFAAIAVKALNVPPNTGVSSFNDVPAKYWAAPAIGAVSNAGLVTGFPDSTFKPEDKLTRAQALVILAKALGNVSADARDLSNYSDASTVPSWALPSVSRAASAHIIANFPDAATIAPNALATRGEVAALMYQTLLALHKPLPRITIGLLPQYAGAQVLVPGQSSQPAQASVPAVETLHLDNVEVSPAGKLAAGDVLTVRAFGSANAVANFSIREGVQQVPMDERRDGVYEGSYTVRKSDNIGRTRVVVSLAKDGVPPASRQSRSELMIDALPPEILVEPRANSTADSAQPNIVVKFSDGHGSGVDVTSVHLLVNGQDVTAQAIVDGGMIAYKPTQPMIGSISAGIKVADKCGNAVDYNWTFRIPGPGAGNLPGPAGGAFNQGGGNANFDPNRNWHRDNFGGNRDGGNN